MTGEEVRETLKTFKKLCRECGQWRCRIRQKQEDMHFLRSVISNGTCRQRGVGDSVERAIELLDGMIRYYAGRVAEREEAERVVQGWVDSLENPDWRETLSAYYVEGLSAQDAADRLYISVRTLWNRVDSATEWIAAHGGEESPHASY